VRLDPDNREKVEPRVSIKKGDSPYQDNNETEGRETPSTPTQGSRTVGALGDGYAFLAVGDQGKRGGRS
jgi:hypothetical protein